MRRQSTSSYDPESEGARQERDSIAGDRNRLQEEMLSLAKTKQRLEKEIEEGKVHLENELSHNREKVERELQRLDRDLSDNKKNVAALEIIKQGLLNENKGLESVGLELKDHNKKQDLLKREIDGKVLNLVNDKVIIEDQIDASKKELEKTNKDKIKLEEVIFSLESRKTDLHNDISGLSVKLDEVNFSLRNNEKNLTNAQEKLKPIIFELTEKNNELQVLNGKLTDIQKQVEDHSASMAKSESEISEKKGNLALLEQRVDEKLELFSRFKEKFTVDELAKMKTHANLV